MMISTTEVEEVEDLDSTERFRKFWIHRGLTFYHLDIRSYTNLHTCVYWVSLGDRLIVETNLFGLFYSFFPDLHLSFAISLGCLVNLSVNKDGFFPCKDLKMEPRNRSMSL